MLDESDQDPSRQCPDNHIDRHTLAASQATGFCVQITRGGLQGGTRRCVELEEEEDNQETRQDLTPLTSSWLTLTFRAFRASKTLGLLSGREACRSTSIKKPLDAGVFRARAHVGTKANACGTCFRTPDNRIGVPQLGCTCCHPSPESTNRA